MIGALLSTWWLSASNGIRWLEHYYPHASLRAKSGHPWRCIANLSIGCRTSTLRSVGRSCGCQHKAIVLFSATIARLINSLKSLKWGHRQPLLKPQAQPVLVSNALLKPKVQSILESNALELPQAQPFFVSNALDLISGHVKGPCLVLVTEWQSRWTNCVYVRYTGD